MEDPTRKTNEELIGWLETVHEKYFIEMKEASDLPRSFWESYSSFSNTKGGWIILGVSEGKIRNTINGVGNESKLKTDLWNQLSNPSKVSFRTVQNEDVNTIVINGAKVVFIHVHEAGDGNKPVYLNDKLNMTYIRTGDGDRIATKEEIESMLRNARPAEDSQMAEHFTIKDFDAESLALYKSEVGRRYPSREFIKMTDENFLKEIGAATIHRETGKWIPKRGAILFLGKVNSIKELYPSYHLDYFNRRGNVNRWNDRVSDDEPIGEEINIFNFYRIVYEKLKALLTEKFALDDAQLRLPIVDFNEPIREALVNCLAHADYVQAYPSTKVEAFDGWFRFFNPGKMLVSEEQFFAGGDSRPRNEIVMKMFRLLGASERQGFGGPLIVKSTTRNNFRYPELETNLEHTELKIWDIDLADSYPDLRTETKSILRYLMKSSQPIAVKNIVNDLKLTSYKAHKALDELINKFHLVRILGNGPSTRYEISMRMPEKYTQLQVAMEELKKSLSD